MWMNDMWDKIGTEFIFIGYYFLVQLRQIFLYWVIGMVIGSIVSVFFKDKIHGLMRNMKSDGGTFVGVIAASVLGVLSPLCMYGTIPIAASFSRSGVKDEWLAAFMMSSILLNPQLIIYSAALGMKVLLIRIITCFLCGITAGILIKIFYGRKQFDSPENIIENNEKLKTTGNKDNNEKSEITENTESKDENEVVEDNNANEFFNFSSFDEPKNKDTDPNLFIRFLKNLLRNVKATGLYFLIGILLSAIFQRYVPQEAVTFLFGGNEAWGVLMASTVGVPLYVCGGGTIPILQAWLANGMSLGSAAAFMITGPATKITNLGALKVVLGIKHFVFYWLYIILFSCVAGIIINLIL